MPLKKDIITPAGNTLGTWGVVTQAAIVANADGMNVVSCALSLYASEDSQKAGKPAVALYRYPVKATFAGGDDSIALAEKALLASEDAGTFVTAGSQPMPGGQQGWVPGWSGTTIIAAPPKV